MKKKKREQNRLKQLLAQIKSGAILRSLRFQFIITITLVIIGYLIFTLTILFVDVEESPISESLIAYPVEVICDSGVPCVDGIKLINLDDGSSEFIDAGHFEPITMRFSPDGKIVAVGSGTSLRLYNAVTLEPIFIFDGEASPASWSPDSSMLAVVSGGYGSEPYGLHILQMDSFHAEQITEGLFVSRFTSWSPDGIKLLFSTGERFYDGMDIFLLDIQSSEVTRITNNSDSHVSPNWSSDGTKFVYASGEEKWNSLVIQNEIEILDIIEIDVEYIGRPEWVMNDERIVLFVQENGGSVLYMLDPQTRDMISVSDKKSIAGYDISADGERVVYLTTRENELCIFDLVSQERTCLEGENPFYWGQPVWVRS